MKTVAFFNNKGGVGKTSLVYHLAWMYADLGLNVLAVDLDPQSNLTASFLSEDRLEELWPEEGAHKGTVFGAIQPLKEGTGDILEAHVEELHPGLGLLVGDLGLSGFEDELSAQWPKCGDGDPRAFRVETAFWRIIQQAGSARGADVALIDVGPNLGAINRSAMISSDYVVMPLAPDLYSIQGLRNLGPTMREWRKLWQSRINSAPPTLGFALPRGDMEATGYVVLQHSVRLDRPTKAYDRWMEKIPAVYYSAVLGQEWHDFYGNMHCLATLKHFRSLMAMAHEAGKPIFHLRSADGAIGSHAQRVQEALVVFRNLAKSIADRIGLGL